MGNAAATLAQLRASLARAGLEPPEHHACAPLGFRMVDAVLKGGLRKGALHEMFAVPGHEGAATGFALAAAHRLCGRKPLLWIRQDYAGLEQGEPAATGLLEIGLDPARVLILRVADAVDGLRAASDALSTSALGAVLIEISGGSKVLDLTNSRRLTLAAAGHRVTALLLRFGAEMEPSAAETRWLIRAACSNRNNEDWGNPAFETTLVRNRHGATGHWVLEWSCDDAVFKERTADRGAVVCAPSDRPVAAAVEGARSAGGLRTAV